MDVPLTRKRRLSNSVDEDDPVLDDCAAAMVLMSLSCSPKSPLSPPDQLKGHPTSSSSSFSFWSRISADSGFISSSATATSSRTTTPSPPSVASSSQQANSSSVDGGHFDLEAIELEEATVCFEEDERHTQLTDAAGSSSASYLIADTPEQAKASAKVLFKCTWRGCGVHFDQCKQVENHIRSTHLGRTDDSDSGDNEELEFYYTEIELDDSDDCEKQPHSDHEDLTCPLVLGGSSAPTWSHLDMVRPPTEDPEYKKSLVSSPINIPGSHRITGHSGHSYSSTPGVSLLNFSSPKNNKFMRIHSAGHIASKSSAHSPGSAATSSRSLLVTPPTGKMGQTRTTGRSRGELRKCRKIYGMEARDLWCTQCKWKKACSRFSG
ncbi:putative zinc finger protein [Halotydeus destructor]|nr:putative zinc finger protein [Halotydeus destructor]